MIGRGHRIFLPSLLSVVNSISAMQVALAQLEHRSNWPGRWNEWSSQLPSAR
jgi:hypothetical protein